MLFVRSRQRLHTRHTWVVSSSVRVRETLEYSARRMLGELVCVPFDFVGKKAIGIFGYAGDKLHLQSDRRGRTAGQTR